MQPPSQRPQGSGRERRQLVRVFAEAIACDDFALDTRRRLGRITPVPRTSSNVQNRAILQRRFDITKKAAVIFRAHNSRAFSIGNKKRTRRPSTNRCSIQNRTRRTSRFLGRRTPERRGNLKRQIWKMPRPLLVLDPTTRFGQSSRLHAVRNRLRRLRRQLRS